MMSVELEPIAILPENLSILRSAQSCGALDHGVEYPLHVARRSGDNLQKLADRGVLLQRFRQALFKQPVAPPTLHDLATVGRASLLAFADLRLGILLSDLREQDVT